MLWYVVTYGNKSHMSSCYAKARITALLRRQLGCRQGTAAVWRLPAGAFAYGVGRPATGVIEC